MRLGKRGFGIVGAAFYFSRVASSDRLLPMLEAIRLRDPSDPALLLVPRGQSIELLVRDAARKKQVTLLDLDAHVDVDSGGNMVVDLADFVIANRFAELDPIPFLWPRYWLVLDPVENRFWYGGCRIDFASRSRLPQVFLMEMAARPGQTVVRNDLCPAMWPDDYGGKKTLEVDWDRRIRDQKKNLGEQLATAADGVADVPADPIRAIAGTDIEGGYALDIPAARILWWSERSS